MRKEDKNSIIEQIAATVKEYNHFYLVDVTAMNATATSALRRDCFKSDIKLMVVKNTLLHKALESLEEDFSPLYGSLKGTTAVMFSNLLNNRTFIFLSHYYSVLLDFFYCFRVNLDARTHRARKINTLNICTLGCSRFQFIQSRDEFFRIVANLLSAK